VHSTGPRRRRVGTGGATGELVENAVTGIH
jgi:hypothetical protein